MPAVVRPKYPPPLSRVEVDAVLHALDPVELRSPIVRRVAARGFATEDVLGRLALRLERNVRRLPDAPTALVHFGCKSGGIGLWLAEAARSHLIAVDPDPVAVEHAMRTCGGFALDHFPSFQHAPFEATQLAMGSAYAVTSLEALYLSQYPRDALAEVHRILDDGGVLLFDTYVADADPTAAAWVHALEQTGFDVLDIDDQTPHWRAVMRQQHIARLEYETYLIERLGHKRAMQEVATSRALLSMLEGTRRIELVARRRRTRFARSSSRLVLRTPVVPTAIWPTRVR